MKFVLPVGTLKFLLDAQQVARITEVLDGAPRIEDKWMGSGNGRPGSPSNAYLTVLINPAEAPLSSALSVGVMSDAEYNLLKFTTAATTKES